MPRSRLATIGAPSLARSIAALQENASCDMALLSAKVAACYRPHSIGKDKEKTDR
jgi:hypothetical protein